MGRVSRLPTTPGLDGVTPKHEGFLHITRLPVWASDLRTSLVTPAEGGLLAQALSEHPEW